MADLREAVDRRLSALAPVGQDALARAIRHALLAPGKRLRPIATVLASWELGRTDLAALDAGCALEMIHAASLVLDDLPCMDDAPTRRGRPSTHLAFGEDVAVLAAISLLSQAYGVAARSAGLDGPARAKVVGILAEAVGFDGLAGGQFRDLRGRGGASALVEANHLKTGVLFVAATDIGSCVAGADAAETERLRACATHLGQAFQLMDDLADGAFGAQEPAEDRGKTTLLTVLGPGDARRRLAAHVAHAQDGLRPGGLLATFVAGIFESASAVPAHGPADRVDA